MSSWLAGRLPRVERLLDMCAMLGIRIDWLVNGKGPKELENSQDEKAQAALAVYNTDELFRELVGQWRGLNFDSRLAVLRQAKLERAASGAEAVVADSRETSDTARAPLKRVRVTE